MSEPRNESSATLCAPRMIMHGAMIIGSRGDTDQCIPSLVEAIIVPLGKLASIENGPHLGAFVGLWLLPYHHKHGAAYGRLHNIGAGAFGAHLDVRESTKVDRKRA